MDLHNLNRRDFTIYKSHWFDLQNGKRAFRTDIFLRFTKRALRNMPRSQQETYCKNARHSDALNIGT